MPGHADPVRRGAIGPCGRACGASLAETLCVLCVLAVALLATAPKVLEAKRAAATACAAREMGTLFRGLRYRAIHEGRAYGLFFEREGEGWRWAVYRDGDGDGMRADDIHRGRDTLVEGPSVVRERWSGVELAVPGAAPSLGPPPSRDDLRNGDPVRFGGSDLVSFTPRGTSSSGTLYVRSGERSWAVVLYGPSVRVRFWERRGREWVRR